MSRADEIANPLAGMTPEDLIINLMCAFGAGMVRDEIEEIRRRLEQGSQLRERLATALGILSTVGGVENRREQFVYDKSGKYVSTVHEFVVDSRAALEIRAAERRP